MRSSSITAVEAGLDLAIIHPSHVIPFAEIPEEERKLAEDLIFYRKPEALQEYIQFYEGREDVAVTSGPDPMAEMTVRDRLHYRIVYRKERRRGSGHRPGGRRIW